MPNLFCEVSNSGAAFTMDEPSNDTAKKSATSSSTVNVDHVKLEKLSLKEATKSTIEFYQKS